MDVIAMLSKQSKEAYLWIHKLIDTLSEDKWDEIPNGMASSISWQVGHLVISSYYHTILVIKGHQNDILSQVPLKKYSEFYGINSVPQNAKGVLTIAELKAHLAIVEQKSLEIVSSLNIEELKEVLVPGNVKHPIAETKLEAIDWNVKHTMWHCGQIASLKSVLGYASDFRLQKE